MKRVLFPILALVLALGLALPMATPAMANDVEPPPGTECVTLWAGQDIDAGCVYVWNDANNLYVRYETSGDWVITETHLHVAASQEAIPQTQPNKKGKGGGNPIPGHFDYSDPHGMVTEYTYTIVRGELALGELYIAAHAVVVQPIADCWETVWMIGDVESADCNDDLTNYANEFNWMKADGSGAYTLPVGDCEKGPGLNANEPDFTSPFIAGTTDDSEFPYNSNYGRPYAIDFDVQWSGELLFGGMLTMSWSPGQSAAETKVISGDGITTAILNATGVSSPGQGWFWDTYPLVQHSVGVDLLPDGQHTINFQHTKGDGTFWDWIRLDKPCEQWETAWAGIEVGELPFPGKNWATYFTYELERVLVDTVTVPANKTTATSSSIPLEDGVEYLLEASGTAFAGDTIDFDAKYSITNRIAGDTWTDIVSGYEGYGTELLDLQVNGASVDWGTYNPEHVYYFTMTGTGTPIQLQIYDIYYPNNTGELTVKIYK